MSAQPSLVEVVARAIYAQRILNIYPSEDARYAEAIDRGSRIVMDEARAAIRAVLDALAEPTEAMLTAGWNHTAPGACYRAMIAARRSEVEG